MIGCKKYTCLRLIMYVMMNSILAVIYDDKITNKYNGCIICNLLYNK